MRVFVTSQLCDTDVCDMVTQLSDPLQELTPQKNLSTPGERAAALNISASSWEQE